MARRRFLNYGTKLGIERVLFYLGFFLIVVGVLLTYILASVIGGTVVLALTVVMIVSGFFGVICFVIWFVVANYL